MSPAESPWYFAYGSNLARGRLEARVGECGVVGEAALGGYRLSFHKRGRDGSGKCTVSPTGDTADLTVGVVYRLSRGQSLRLDEFEGPGYRREIVQVSVGARTLAAYTYVAPPESLDPGLLPYEWYHTLVVEGARAHRLRPDYILALERTAFVQDPDRDRAARNLASLARAACD